MPADKLTRDRIEHAAREVAPLLLKHLRRRYRALSAEHDDLVQQTLLDLLEFLRAHDDRVPTQSDLAALAFTILKRRIADRFRDAAWRAAQAHADSDDSEVAAPTAPLDAGLHYRKLLWAVLQALTALDASDRDLLLRDQLPADETIRPMSPAERKRLSRLRDKLRSALVSRFGSADEFLGS